MIYRFAGVRCAVLTLRYTCPNTRTHSSCDPPAQTSLPTRPLQTTDIKHFYLRVYTFRGTDDIRRLNALTEFYM
jgi:hypothetical protein